MAFPQRVSPSISVSDLHCQPDTVHLLAAHGRLKDIIANEDTFKAFQAPKLSTLEFDLNRGLLPKEAAKQKQAKEALLAPIQALFPAAKIAA